MIADMKNPIGESTIINLSNGCILPYISMPFFSDLILLFLYIENKIQAYNTICSSMLARQSIIHLIRAVVESFDLGVDVATELRVFMLHSESVTNKPRRPGILSAGITKLICRKKY